MAVPTRKATGTSAVERVRVAIVGTPRSGNTWLRWCLCESLNLREVAVHRVRDVRWGRLPERMALQLHSHADASFHQRLCLYGFQPVVLARHPLDILLSILQYAQHSRSPRKWLGGEGGDEAGLAAATPCSDKFLEYATSRRAAALLSLTPEWSSLPDVQRLRYEDLVADTRTHLQNLCTALGQRPLVPLEQVIEDNRIENLRPRVGNNHFWQGQAGHWRRLLPSHLARQIANTHQAHFAAMSYTCDPDESLTPEQALLNWQAAQLPASAPSRRGLRTVLAGAMDLGLRLFRHEPPATEKPLRKAA